MWYVDFNKDLIILKFESKLEIDEETMKTATDSFNYFGLYYTSLSGTKPSLLSDETWEKLRTFSKESLSFVQRLSLNSSQEANSSEIES
jgi:uncharacterized protein YjaG (DUF416 family)